MIPSKLGLSHHGLSVLELAMTAPSVTFVRQIPLFDIITNAQCLDSVRQIPLFC